MKNVLLQLICYVVPLVLFGQGFPANKTYSYGFMPANQNGQDAVTAYNSWKNNHLRTCNSNTYRVEFQEYNTTVSEGIGYGMLLSVYAGDQTVFDGLWRFYQSNTNSHGLMHWKIGGCGNVIGANAATDAELDVAMALIVAAKKWGSSASYNYDSDARAMIAKIKQFEVEPGSYVLKPGDFFGGSNLTNPSYFATGYFRVFGEFTNDTGFWNLVAAKCYSIIENNLAVHNATGGLVSDWCKADGQYAQEAGGYYNGGTTYFYDASRTPWRIVVDYSWFGTASAKSYLDKVTGFVQYNGGAKNIKDGYYQSGGVYGQWCNGAFAGCMAAATMGGYNQALVNESYSTLVSLQDNSYFNQSLKALNLFFMTGNFYNPLNKTANPNSPGIESGKVYSIISKWSSKSVDVAGTSDGANVQQWSYWNQGANQHFTLVNTSGDYYQIKPLHTGKCLDVTGGSNANGANVIQWTCHSGANQLWKFEKLDDGSFRILSKQSGKALDVEGYSLANGGNIHQWDWTGNDNQRWIVQQSSNFRIENDVEVTKASELQIYPNPANELVNLVIQDEYFGGNLVLLNQYGLEVENRKIEANEMTLSLAGRSKGIYIVRLLSPFGQELTQKLQVY